MDQNFSNQESIILEQGDQPKTRNIVFYIVLGVIGVAAIIAIIVFANILFDNKQEEPEETKKQPIVQQETEEPKKTMTAAEKEAAAKAVLSRLKSAAEESVDDLQLDFQDIYDTDSPFYLPKNAKTGLMLDKSFGIHFGSQTLEDLSIIETVAEAVIDKLDELGFTEYDEIELIAGPEYLNAEDEIICSAVTASLPFTITCGHTSWITTEKLAFINSLAEAYYEKEGEYPQALNASKSDIIDSVYEPYQRLTASMLDAGALFYRPSKTADWVFFTSGQAAPTCAEFSKDPGARRAFQGQTCVNNSGEPETITAG